MDIEIYLQHIETRENLKKELNNVEQNINSMVNELNIQIGEELRGEAIRLFDPNCTRNTSDVVKGMKFGKYNRIGNRHTIDYNFEVGKYLFQKLKEDKHSVNGRFKHEINLITTYDIVKKTFKYHTEFFGWFGGALLKDENLAEALQEMFWNHVPRDRNEEITIEEVKVNFSKVQETLDNYYSFYLATKLAEENH